MPPNNEHTITAPLPENELRQLIHQTYGDDESTAMLTQVYWFLPVIEYIFLQYRNMYFKIILEFLDFYNKSFLIEIFER